MGITTSKSKINLNLSRDKIKAYLLGDVEVLDEYSEIDYKLKFYCNGDLCIKYDSITKNIDEFTNIFIEKLACETHTRPGHLVYDESHQNNNTTKSSNYFHYLFRKYWIESQVIPKIPFLKTSAVLSFLYIYLSKHMNEDVAKRILEVYKQIKYCKKYYLSNN